MASLTTVPAFAQNTLPEGSLKMIVTPHNQSVNSYERTLCLNIKANVKYTVSSDQSWVKVRKGSDNSVYVHVDQNYAMEARSANVEFVSNDGKISQTLVVTQAADGSAADSRQTSASIRLRQQTTRMLIRAATAVWHTLMTTICQRSTTRLTAK